MSQSSKTDWLLVKAAREPANIGREIEVRGWVRTRRDSKGGFSFIEINDGSCFDNLQIIAEAKLENYASEVASLPVGSSIAVSGLLKKSEGQGQATELVASCFRVLGLADPEHYPLQKKRHTFEKLREWAHLRPRTNTFGAVSRVRNSLAMSIHHFFQEEDFYYLNSPIITASDCEGAGQMFRVTTLPLDKLPLKDGKVDFSRDFFGRSSFLTVSGQLEGEIYATALGRVYTFGPTFRAENSHTTRHLSEFWMVEPEAAFFELADNMALAERFIKRILKDVLNNCPDDMKFFEERVQPGLMPALQQVLDKPFEHLSYTEAIDILKKSGKSFEYPVEWGCDLQAEHERFLTEEHVKGPLVLFNYPKSIKPFYMRCNDDDRTVTAMDVLVPNVGEIIGGSQREERLDVLLDRMRQMGLHEQDYWWYIDLRRFGTVPHSGFGLGFERAVQWVTGMGNIRDCIPFPRTPGSAEF